jgi:hypothetical protein
MPHDLTCIFVFTRVTEKLKGHTVGEVLQDLACDVFKLMSLHELVPAAVMLLVFLVAAKHDTTYT